MHDKELRWGAERGPLLGDNKRRGRCAGSHFSSHTEASLSLMHTGQTQREGTAQEGVKSGQWAGAAPWLFLPVELVLCQPLGQSAAIL